MTDEERLATIRASAAKHGGRYLLPRRFGARSLAKTEDDLHYDACEELVRRGEARWLPSIGGPGPGVQIVRSPIEPVAVPPMPLEEALSRLAAVHTRDDHEVGWHVVVGASPDPFMMGQGDYVRAWEAVRRHLKLQIDPATVREP